MDIAGCTLSWLLICVPSCSIQDTPPPLWPLARQQRVRAGSRLERQTLGRPPAPRSPPSRDKLETELTWWESLGGQGPSPALLSNSPPSARAGALLIFTSLQANSSPSP